MKYYTSTRNRSIGFHSKDAIRKGIADDGGLYVLDDLDALQLPLETMMGMNYQEMAAVVLGALLPDFSGEEIADCVASAYDGEFSTEDITPLQTVGGTHILELFHGPTCAFKDVGLRMLPQLMSKALKERQGERIMILTATSGDTGKAALEGFRDVDRVGITVFYPENGVSEIQHLQMATQEGKNTCVSAVRGNFDDAQSRVKKIFGDSQLAARLAEANISLSSANSINIGRLVPQVVYYIFAYREMVRTGQIAFGDRINFSVPTGNFGNVLAGYYAKCMGLPVNRLIVAANSNHVLSDFLTDGVYDRNRPFHQTISPSMDILISSNLERLIYYKSGKDTGYIAYLMEQLDTEGRYQVREDIFNSIAADFYGGYCTQKDCAETIRCLYEATGYVMDPHTANAYKVQRDYEKQDTTCKTVLLATASPHKFASTVYEAIFGKSSLDEFSCMQQLQLRTGAEIPEPLQRLKEKTIRHRDVIDTDAMSAYTEKTVRGMFV